MQFKTAMMSFYFASYSSSKALFLIIWLTVGKGTRSDKLHHTLLGGYIVIFTLEKQLAEHKVMF